ncbi:hypothetical protein FNL55_07425 [Tardiphaga sp. vice352]|nr:hypothetical protein FNL53_07715 [Tardiphaga sp. vice278]QDM20911.1 hypothetical protein FIU28_07080 [Tardiphaga sp. vice154]QDM31152.1 hypothetical protein FNL55_07425 [Tardiphaga sp. vice352]
MVTRYRLTAAVGLQNAIPQGRDLRTALTIDHRPVHDYTMTNDVQYIPPEARLRSIRISESAILLVGGPGRLNSCCRR